MASSRDTPETRSSDAIRQADRLLNEDRPPADSSWLRRIGCVSTSRADAGIYRPLLEALAAEPGRQVRCFAGGTHLAEQFGRTIEELSNLPGVKLTPVDHFVPGDDPVHVAETAGLAVGAFARAFAEHPIDLVFVLGDRTEMLAAALAAVIRGLPIAHLHGGDTTAGAYDDVCRQALTKLAHVHFPALPQHAGQIRALDEEPWRIHAVGALALDALRNFTPEPPAELTAATGLDWARGVVVVAFHPETLAPLPAERQVEEVAAAVAPLDAQLLILGPNADVGHVAVAAAWAKLASSRPGTVLLPTLTPGRFWSCLAHARLLVGNSSAGVIEAASFRLPVVNIGGRQTGRVCPANVVSVTLDRAAIVDAIRRAADPAFRAGLSDLVNPYGDGRTVPRILTALRNLPSRATLLCKP
jgi:UDP-hydrolysing UDP-N-acetyl-D-glucosamine 2-epimerase